MKNLLKEAEAAAFCALKPLLFDSGAISAEVLPIIAWVARFGTIKRRWSNS